MSPDVSGGLGSRTTTPDAATWLNLNRPRMSGADWRGAIGQYVDALEQEFLDREARCVRAEEALRQAEIRANTLEGAVRSTQDTLLLKVPRTQAVREQLEINRAALAAVPEENEAVGGNTP